MLASSLLVLSLAAGGDLSAHALPELGAAAALPAPPELVVQVRSPGPLLTVRLHPTDDPYDEGDPGYQGSAKPGWLLLSSVVVLGFGVGAGIKAISLNRQLESPDFDGDIDEITRKGKNWQYTSLGALGLSAVGFTVFALW